MIYIGTISSVKGLDGSVVLSDVPSGIKQINVGDIVKIGFSEAFAKNFTVTKWIRLARHALLTVKEIANPEVAASFKEQGVFIEKEKLKKNKVNTMESELVGFTAVDADSWKVIGQVAEIWEMPANDVMVIRSEDSEFTIPLIPEL